MHAELTRAFARQRDACEALRAPFMMRLMTILPDLLQDAPALVAQMEAVEGDPGPAGASLPLRLAGGLHALVLAGKDPALAAAYPPQDVTDDALRHALAAALGQEAFLLGWMNSAPQTNETGRSAVLLAVAGLLTARFGLPLRLSELGASAGLNLQFDRYRLEAGGQVLGSADSGVRLRPDWRGLAPDAVPLRVADRRGVDLNPLDPQMHGLKLMAYVWPDHAERLARLRAALALGGVAPDCGTAADWLTARLGQPWPGQCHLVFHTIAHQYFSPAEQARIAAVMAAAGGAATPQSPLAWFGMEADGAGRGAALTLQLWPGDERISLGRAGFHGEWVEWTPP